MPNVLPISFSGLPEVPQVELHTSHIQIKFAVLDTTQSHAVTIYLSGLSGLCTVVWCCVVSDTTAKGEAQC